MSSGWTLSKDFGSGWPGLDPYSQWLLWHGAEFVPKVGEATGKPPIMGVIDRETLVSHTKGGHFLQGVVSSLDNPILTPEEFDRLKNRPKRAQDRTTQLIFRLPMRPESLPVTPPPSGQRAPPQDWKMRFDPTGTTPVIVVVIDDIMNIADDRLCDDTGQSRVEFAWVQDAIAQDGAGVSPVPFGREWMGRDVDALRRTYGHNQDRILQGLGLRTFAQAMGAPLDRRYSHGSHVLDLAGGGDPGATECNGLRLISVMLPQASTRESSGALLGFYVLTGLQYALKRARIIQKEIGIRVPVIVNFSYGITGGPHDGSHIVEELIQTAIKQESSNSMPVTMVMPAGNNRLDRGHAVAEPKDRGPCVLDLPWRIQPGDSTPNYLEVWIPAAAAWSTLRITLPDGTELEADGFPQHPAFLVKNKREDVIARISLDQPQGSGGKQRLLFAMIPTATTLSGQKGRAAQAGIWKVRVSAKVDPGGRIEAWIQRDVWPLRENAETRQSYFDDPAYVRFSKTGVPLVDNPADGDAVVQRRGALNGLATASQRFANAPVVVGGTIGTSGKIARYSGLPDGRMIGGVFGAQPIPMMSERQENARGVLAAGSRSGSVVALGGTSVAAPQVTRLLAEAIMTGTLDTPARAHDWLEAEMARNAGTLPAKGRQSRA